MYEYKRLLDPIKTGAYSTPQQLLEACVSYFEWSDDNPLEDEKIFFSSKTGKVTRSHENRVRAFSVRALCVHLGLSVNNFHRLAKKGENWADAIERVKEIIYSQKFEHAAAGMLNASIISKDLGLTEKVSSEVTSPDGSMSGGGGPTFVINKIPHGNFIASDKALEEFEKALEEEDKEQNPGSV